MEKSYTIISMMGGKAQTRDAAGLMREFEVSELITLALAGTEFIPESSICREAFCRSMAEIFISKK